MRHLLRLVASAALALFLPSCAFVRSMENEPIDPVVVRSFVPGKTTAAEVTQKLGAPSQIIELGERSAYRYEHVKTKGAGFILILFILGNADTRSDRVWLFFDKNDVLTHLGSTFESHRPQYAFTWEDVHEKADSDAADAERPGLTGN